MVLISPYYSNIRIFFGGFLAANLASQIFFGGFSADKNLAAYSAIDRRWSLVLNPTALANLPSTQHLQLMRGDPIINVSVLSVCMFI